MSLAARPCVGHAAARAPAPRGAFRRSPAAAAGGRALSSPPRSRAGSCRTRLARSASASSESSPATKSGDRSAGRMVYYPSSFNELLADACAAIKAGAEDGLKFMEVEFPPVPGQVDGYKGSSDTFIDANIQLALVGARKLAEDGKRVHVVLPDNTEYARARKMFASTLDMEENVTMGYLTEKEWSFSFSLKGLGIGSSNSMYDSGAAAEKQTSEDAERADVFIAINASAVELLEVETYAQNTVKDRPLVLWNLELETLRADLGLLGFPPKDLQYRFLSKFKPVFYIRQRDYSKTVSVAPFILNYSGAIFREYPGPWQVMLKQDNGELACIAESEERYTLTEAKEEMMETMGLNTEEEGSTMAFLRRGYKRATWWEEDRENETSTDWRL